MMNFMLQKYGSFRKREEKDYEEEMYSDISDSFGDGDDRLLVRIKRGFRICRD